MKNKALIGTLCVLVLLVIVSLIHESKQDNRPNIHHKGHEEKVRVGILQFVTHDALDAINKGIYQGLEESGYNPTNVIIDYLNAEADQSKIQTMSKRLVSNNNDVLVGIATPAAQGLANATHSIPVVMGAVSDPVGAKLVADLKHPKHNVTGVSNQVPIVQEVDLIKTLTPNIKNIGVIYSSSEDNSKSQVEKFQKEATKRGLNVSVYAVPSTNDITPTLSVMANKVDALFIPQDNTMASAMTTIVAATRKTNIPIYVVDESMVKNGGFAAVSQDQFDLGVATGKMTAHILKGERVENIPVQVIDTGTPVVNEKVAKELGIVISQDIITKHKLKVMKN